MGVDGGDPLVGARLLELGCDHLLDGEDNTVLATDADGCASILDGLNSVLDLEIATIGREDGVEQVVTCADRRLRDGISSGIP